MSDVKIKSTNQSGGITGQNVNTGKNVEFSVSNSEKKETKSKALFWWIFGLLGAVASAITIASYFF